MASGALKLRSGYTPTGVTTGDGNGNPIHSLLYYEQFSAAYTGPQFVMYGKGATVFTGPVSSSSPTQIATMGSGNPWGHFRANNYVCLGTGAASANTNITAAWELSDLSSWDGLTIRPLGLPSVNQISVLNTLSYAQTASTVSAGTPWSNLNNILGAPNNTYATAVVPPLGPAGQLIQLSFNAFSIPSVSLINGITITVKGHTTLPVILDAQLSTGPGNFSPIKSGLFTSGPDQNVPFGSSTDSWGLNPTPALMNSLVVLLSANGSGFSPTTWSLDSCQVTIFYSGVNGVTVSVTTSTLGSFTPTQLTGYQLYLSVYNPFTGHVGNRVAIGNYVTVSTVASELLVGSLTPLSGINSEWVYAIGMTNDGGQIPYWLVDNTGKQIIIGNNATNATVVIGNTNALLELPFANDPPPALDKFARVGTRIFAAKAGNPFLSYSNDAADVSNANYVGNPWESWPADQQEPLPTGKTPTAVHGYRLEGWFFDKNYLSIWSQFLFQQGANPWRGPWQGGCCAQRAFVETPYGPYWVTPQKQLCTFVEDGVISVSDEYEAALLGKLSTNTLGNTEIAYLLDPENFIDELVIKGLDANGNTVIIVHDFHLRDERSEYGQGYTYTYVGQTVTTFCGAGFTPRQNAFDGNSKERLWAGNAAGNISQLEDGSNSDAGSEYAGDYISLLNLGPNRPKLNELQIQGDGNLQVSFQTDYNDGNLADFLPTVQPAEALPGESTRYAYKINPPNEPKWAYLRLQLTSHHNDGSFALTDPPFLPLPSYGVINMVDLTLGLDRIEGR